MTAAPATALLAVVFGLAGHGAPVLTAESPVTCSVAEPPAYYAFPLVSECVTVVGNRFLVLLLLFGHVSG